MSATSGVHLNLVNLALRSSAKTYLPLLLLLAVSSMLLLLLYFHVLVALLLT